MKFWSLLTTALLLATLGCGNSGPVSSSTSSRSYSGTASVGDFLSITLDPVAQTLTYSNYSNGDNGTVPYTVNGDGSYTLNDPTGNLQSAYEVPGYGLLIAAAKTGPSHNTPALITAVEKSTISISMWAGQQFNYMQFRTAAGGLEVGSVTLDAQGNVSVSNYWPYGALGLGQPANSFGTSYFDSSSFQADSSDTFLKFPDQGGQGTGYDYVFGTNAGVFAVDTLNGAILSFKKADSKNFDSSYAGTYKAVYYVKTNASTGQGNVETGTPSLAHATVVVGSSGQLTVTDAQGIVLLQASLVPVADQPDLYDGTQDKLHNPCWGLFTVRPRVNPSQDIFATFVNGAMLFSSFTAQNGGTYEYFYGVGLK